MQLLIYVLFRFVFYFQFLKQVKQKISGFLYYFRRFTVNLFPGTSFEESSLHISVRFDEGCIVRNNINNGEYGEEEREGGMPLKRGESFQLKIISALDHYKVSDV